MSNIILIGFDTVSFIHSRAASDAQTTPQISPLPKVDTGWDSRAVPRPRSDASVYSLAMTSRAVGEDRVAGAARCFFPPEWFFLYWCDVRSSGPLDSQADRL